MSFLLWPFRLVVLIGQSVLLALGQIWTNRLRSFLTTIGIVIGVASVTAVIAALSGLEKRVLDELQSFGTNKMWAFPRIPDSQRGRDVTWDQYRFKPELFDDLLRLTANVDTFTRQVRDTYNVRSGTQKVADVSLMGVEPSWFEIQNRAVIAGRPFSVIDDESGRRVCLITPGLQAALGMDRDPVDQEVFIGDERFTVIGVVEEEPDRMMFGRAGETQEIVVPWRAAYRMQPDANIILIANAVSTDATPEAVAEVTHYLRSRRGLAPGEEDNFGVQYVDRFVQQFRSLSQVITAVATGIVGISLLVGGVGIMNIMLVSVSERTREIGLRKAVGAPPIAILMQFLVEAVVLCLMGGAIGLGIGQLIVTGMSQVPQMQLDSAFIPTWAIILAIGFSVSVGVIFGMFPAIKAARLDPIEALRHE